MRPFNIVLIMLWGGERGGRRCHFFFFKWCKPLDWVIRTFTSSESVRRLVSELLFILRSVLYARHRSARLVFAVVCTLSISSTEASYVVYSELGKSNHSESEMEEKGGETSRTARSNLEGWQAKQSTFQIIQDDGRLIFFLHLND